MNAKTFFTEEQFNRLKADIAEQRITRIDEYQHQHRVNGNTYKVTIYTSRYSFGNHDFFVSCWVDYNYPGPYQSRNIGGGNSTVPSFDSWQAFRDSINKTLSRFPDYTPEEEEFYQTSIFDI